MNKEYMYFFASKERTRRSKDEQCSLYGVFFCLFAGGNDRYQCVVRVVYLVMVINKKEKREKRKEYYGNNGALRKQKEEGRTKRKKKTEVVRTRLPGEI